MQRKRGVSKEQWRRQWQTLTEERAKRVAADVWRLFWTDYAKRKKRRRP